MTNILIVDDDAKLRSNLTEVLEGAGYRTESAASANEALTRIEAREFDIALLDYLMPKMNGLEALTAMRKLRPKTKIIIITAFATIDNAVDAVKKGASEYISKPFKIEQLLTTIRRVLEEARFDECMTTPDFDQALNSLANPIRRNIIKLLHARQDMRLMEITRELEISDHTKVVFHLKILKEAGIIEQNNDKTYALTKEGQKTLNCLKILKSYLQG